ACCISEATESWPMPGTASATDCRTAFAFRRTPDVAAPADPAAEETVPDILSPTEDTALDAPSPADTAGARAFDSSQAALLGRSLRPVRVARDRRRAGFALPMTPPVFWLPSRESGRPARRSRPYSRRRYFFYRFELAHPSRTRGDL